MKKIITLLFSLLLSFTISAQISGSNSIERGKTAIYTVAATNGANYFWSVTGGVQIVSGQGTNRIIVRGNSNGRVCFTKYGNGLIPDCGCKNISVATINPCNFRIETPELRVLNPNWNQQGETCGNEILEIQALYNSIPEIERFEWKIAGATLHETHTDRDYIFIRTRPIIGTYVDIDFRIHYKCNKKGPWVNLRGRVVDCNFGVGIGLYSAQSKESDKTSLDFNKDSKILSVNKKLPGVIYQIIGLDGKTRKQGVFQDNKSLELNDLSPGFYILNLNNKGVKETIKFYISQ